MAEYRSYTCDWHDYDGSAGSLAYEDQCSDDGWVTFERTVKRDSALPGGRPWTHSEEFHVCGGCVRDSDELVGWLREKGWKPERFSLDAERNLEHARPEAVFL